MLKIPKQYSSLKFVKDISWSEIFGIWKDGEAFQESWKKHWESRGFSSWEEWRKMYVSPLHPEKLEWQLFSIVNPTKDVPFFYAVPSRSWIEKAYQGEIIKQLNDLIDLPIISENPKVLDIKNDFPKKTMLTGIIHNEQIILYEGMHRASAIASWDFSKNFENEILIALAQWKEIDIPIVGGDYKK